MGNVRVGFFTELILNGPQQDELVGISQSRSLPAGYVFRAKLILMLAEGASFRTIKHKLGTTAPTIVRLKERFLSGGIDGLDTHHPRPAAERSDARLAPGFWAPPGKASRWIDALELPQTRGPS